MLGSVRGMILHVAMVAHFSSFYYSHLWTCFPMLLFSLLLFLDLDWHQFTVYDDELCHFSHCQCNEADLTE